MWNKKIRSQSPKKTDFSSFFFCFHQRLCEKDMISQLSSYLEPNLMTVAGLATLGGGMYLLRKVCIK